MISQESIHRIETNTIESVPICDCVNAARNDDSPFYTQLGVSSSVANMRTLMERRLGFTGESLRIEKVRYTGKEGHGEQGCPVAKWVLRRRNDTEKALIIIKCRRGHICQSSVIVISIVIWEGIEAEYANGLYDYIRTTVPTNGYETERRCGLNDSKTCACQGWDSDNSGASYTYGCSWSMFYNGCKFARSAPARKFRLKEIDKEKTLSVTFNSLANRIGRLHQRCSPESFGIMTYYEREASSCRLGNEPGRPYSGVTSVIDFCAHSHRDSNNMNNGCFVAPPPNIVNNSTRDATALDGQYGLAYQAKVEPICPPAAVPPASAPIVAQQPPAPAPLVAQQPPAPPTSSSLANAQNGVLQSHQSGNNEDKGIGGGGGAGGDDDDDEDDVNSHSYSTTELLDNSLHERNSIGKKQEISTDNSDAFSKNDVGGVAVALTHGSILFEVAKRELHATTSMKKPDRFNPTRISLVFYQHKNLNLPQHGSREYERKLSDRKGQPDVKQAKYAAPTHATHAAVSSNRVFSSPHGSYSGPEVAAQNPEKMQQLRDISSPLQRVSDTDQFPPLYGVQAKSQIFSQDTQVKLPPLDEIINKVKQHLKESQPSCDTNNIDDNELTNTGSTTTTSSTTTTATYWTKSNTQTSGPYQ